MTAPAPIEFSDATVVAVSPRQISTAMGAEQAILQLDSGKYFGLNPVGARVWQLLAQPRTVSEVLATLLAEYEVPAERCRADLLALLHKLHAAGLLVVPPAAAPA
jgi:hypothetical protein